MCRGHWTIQCNDEDSSDESYPSAKFNQNSLIDSQIQYNAAQTNYISYWWTKK